MGSALSCSTNLDAIISETELHNIISQMEARILATLLVCIQKEISKQGASVTSKYNTETDDDKHTK